MGTMVVSQRLLWLAQRCRLSLQVRVGVAQSFVMSCLAKGRDGKPATGPPSFEIAMAVAAPASTVSPPPAAHLSYPGRPTSGRAPKRDSLIRTAL